MKFLISLLFLFPNINNYSGCAKFDIIIINDMSGSVSNDEQRNFIADANEAFVNRFDLNGDLKKISIITFKNVGITEAPLTNNKSLLIKQINNIRNDNRGGGSNLLGGLQRANIEFTKRLRNDSHKIIIIISDGQVNYKPEVMEYIENNFTIKGINIFSIYVIAESGDPNYLISISDYYAETNYNMLVKTLEEIDICF